MHRTQREIKLDACCLLLFKAQSWYLRTMDLTMQSSSSYFSCIFCPLCSWRRGRSIWCVTCARDVSVYPVSLLPCARVRKLLLLVYSHIYKEGRAGLNDIQTSQKLNSVLLMKFYLFCSSGHEVGPENDLFRPSRLVSV
jgi:hypothetical protein